MPYAFVHLVFCWAIVKVLQYYKKFKLNNWEWFLVLFGAILPDIDYLFEWTLGFQVHRTFTHSLLMIAFTFIIGYFLLKILANKKIIFKHQILLYTKWLVFGVGTHLLADMIFSTGNGIPLFWPYVYYFGFFTGIQSPHDLVVLYANITLVEKLTDKLRWAIFDMGLGVSWIFYLIYSGKIKEF
jgi:membrane-bound metal-dependent hydrolase YbcI (DUF457 family)